MVPLYRDIKFAGSTAIKSIGEFFDQREGRGNDEL